MYPFGLICQGAGSFEDVDLSNPPFTVCAIDAVDTKKNASDAASDHPIREKLIDLARPIGIRVSTRD